VNVGRTIRIAAFKWHCFIAHSEAATRAYICAVAAIARLIPSRRIRDMIEWAITGQLVPWKPLAFGPKSVVVGDRTQIRLKPHLGEFDQAALFHSRFGYEAPVFAWLERHAPDRYDAVVEVGANVGVYSVFFDALIRACPAGRLCSIYAFEPSRAAYTRLLANLKTNNARSVETFAVAVSNESGFARFYQPEGRLTNGSLSIDFANLFPEPISERLVVTIAGSQLADLFARHARVLLKIDAEGSEPKILTSMASIIERYRPDLLIEVLKGVDEELRSLDVLAVYERFQLTAAGPCLRNALMADDADRDWLLTMSPLKP
jgi:FkbM family methyltransferase